MSQSHYDKLTALGIRLRKHSGPEKTLCPKCSHTRRNRRDLCLSVDIDQGVYNCHNPGCMFRGSVAEYRIPKKEYIRPTWQNITAMPDDVVRWFASRGISQRVLVEMKVGYGMHYMYEKPPLLPAGVVPVIKFPYLRSEELINIKHRCAHKRFMMESSAELIFWNIDAIANETECMIVEGEPDLLSAKETGYNRVISVPNGASIGNNRLEYLDNCIDFFDHKNGDYKITKIIVAVDDDEPGHSLRDELIRRLGAERCWTIDFGYSRSRPDVKWKDHNEVLAGKTLPDGTVVPGDGPLRLAEIYAAARECPIKGILSAEDLLESVLSLYESGLPPGDSVGIKDKDGDLITFATGMLTVVTGVPNHGKTARLDDIICRLAVMHQWKFLVFSPENWPLSLHMSRLTEILIGKPFSASAGPANRLNHDEIIQAYGFLHEHVWWINPEEHDLSLEDILMYAKTMVRRKGIKGLVIDPWNTLEHQRGNLMVDEYVSMCLGKVNGFDHKHGTHTFIVAHPTKLEGVKKGGSLTKKDPVPGMYDINGGAMFRNKVDNGMCVYRDFSRNVIETHIQKIKHRHQGRVGKVEEIFDWRNGRYVPINTPFDTRNWLTEGCGPLPPIPVYQTSDVVVADNSAPDEEKDDHPF